jgi:lipopolysaccharide transport system ATP-binding protein
MSSPIIKVENLSKRYLIGHQRATQERYTALRDVLGQNLKRLWSSARSIAHGQQIVTGDSVEEFWALKDVFFDVNQGEVLGIIGRNGAGKSTLLKILSRITEPTHGRITLNGRVASLLEVGTGFHPELSGRENIYLNGAILGMSRAEIKAKFDEIVDFAEVERFLDTPVKRYSSGMYVRLAFAVAAHLEPEILIVDEVLAVGDALFQKKCLGKMQDVAKGGRTVMFVSHNLSAIGNLCSRAILMEKGMLVFSGSAKDAISRHLAQVNQIDAREGVVASTFIQNCRVRNEPDAAVTNSVIATAPVVFEIDLALGVHKVAAPIVGLGINNEDGTRVTTLGTQLSTSPPCRLDGKCTVRCVVSSLPLVPGTYWLKVAVNDHHDPIDVVDGQFSFRVCESDYFGTGTALSKDQGVFLLKSNWEVIPALTNKSPLD